MISFWIISSMLALGHGEDVSFQYSGTTCYKAGDSLTMTAVYSGSGTVTAVQWYYSGQTSTNLLILSHTCGVGGIVPPGYPDSSRMSYECPSTNTFKLTLSALQDEELGDSWGATFTLSSGTAPAVVKSPINKCSTTTPKSSAATGNSDSVMKTKYLLLAILSKLVLLYC